MAPPPDLNSDAISEILLRLPPDDPAGLVRASAVCKPWLRTLTDPAFLRSYRDFHGTPRVLGFLHNSYNIGLDRFVPTTAFRPHAAAAAHRTCRVLDCRHGRVLLRDSGSNEFVVWDPVTGRERRIPDEVPDVYYTNHAVLCAAGAGCDHSTCSGGPFLLASAGTLWNNANESLARFYSSKTGVWSDESRRCLSYYYHLEDWPARLVGDALYFAGTDGLLLRYDVLGGGGLLVMTPPPGNYCYLSPIVMTAGNGGLGLATFDFDKCILALWSAGNDASWYGEFLDARWSRIKLIDLQERLSTDIGTSAAWLSGFAEDANVIFLSTDDNGIFTIDLKSLMVRKVCETGNVNHVFPYVSFYSPAACAIGTLQSLVDTQ